MASTSSSKKRKRGAEEAEEVSLRLSTTDSSQIGPVLASFPALQPPQSTPFQCYVRPDEGTKEFASRAAVIAGETDTVEFSSTSESQTASAGCSYLVGIHDKRTNTTTFRPAPLHILTRQVKALKNLKPIEVSQDERARLRNNLGETFGTKKAKAAIRAQERRKVDVDAMRGVAGHLQDRIQENTGNLPTLEEAKASADSSRLIPPYDEAATRPEDVYKLHDIIPEAEFNALSVNGLKSAETAAERAKFLPHSRSSWINQHLALLFSTPKPKKSSLKILLYISTMFAFKMIGRKDLNDKQAVQERLKGIPSIVVDGLLSRFTETARGSSEALVTSQMETSLLTHMFALCLHIDDFATDTSLIAKDLSMAVTKVNSLFKSLGCKVGALDNKDLKRLGLPDAAAATKRAILKVPLEFPKTRVRRAAR